LRSIRRSIKLSYFKGGEMNEIISAGIATIAAFGGGIGI
jgi:hypothetical protein